MVNAGRYLMILGRVADGDDDDNDDDVRRGRLRAITS
jgi:hypothetical protein